MKKYLLLCTFSFLTFSYAQDNGPSNDGDNNSANETITSVSLDASNTLSISEGSNSKSVDLSPLTHSGSITPIQTVGNNIASYNTSANTTNIKETVTTLVDNGGGSYTFTNEAGVSVNFSVSGGGILPSISNTSLATCFLDLNPSDNVDTTITGNYFDGDTVLNIAGQTVNSFSVDSPTQITANVTVNAMTNSDITVNNLGGTYTETEAFLLAFYPHTYTVSDMTIVGTGINYDGTTLSSTTTGTAWTRSAYSTAHKIPLGEPGRLDFTADSNAAYMLGLHTNPAASAHYSSGFDFAIYINNTNIFPIVNGAVGTNIGSHTIGSTYSILVHCDGTVTYLKDNVVIYTAAGSPTGDLYLDSTFSSGSGAIINNITLNNITP